MAVIFVSTSIIQCKKEGNLVKDLNRSFTGTADTTIYASFYESNTISPSDATAGVNDVIKFRGVQTIVHEYCATSNCHGGSISPKLDTYAEVMKYITAGNPEGSEMWQFLTTNDFNKAMPPVNSNHEMTVTDKTILYNWILNGAKEKPDLADFRPAAIALIISGCGSANCHNQATSTGGWARKGLIPVTSADTTMYTYINPSTGVPTYYCLLSNETLRNQVWTAYKDSVKTFYADTLANASFRPFKIFALPISSLSTRGALNTYDDILMDITYPKGQRSFGAGRGQTTAPPVYIDPVTLQKYWVKGDHLASGDCFIREIDSTLTYRDPRNLVETSKGGGMSYDDGGLKPSEIALVKAWYFADPNVPDVWKYGIGNAGIFKYRKTGTIIKK